ncbi:MULTISPECIES: ABC transporter ATP-binding protein [unclassified Mesorhizobium]|jgi:branched-chain amino acid transport system ATP-binding protein|uniref:ABC transporter ATP-binding protein n=1 Tax=unclassified Mesorhizobium TaxID=325217 RepID=UPI000FCC0A25|nr:MULTISPECIES: ABC transporter ATP-binding protein [unclassified Mesorhizobium]AZV23304.1 ABC transporter ATP-binding protein [Mesorhizobium sp. M7A.F.Ce.TU.012.03.2.1]RUU81835.1 ABC transporter ATP-binding protein [Mesorhizobium sp. M7A.F.Ca.MR.362.00.0.0]RUU91838.1 ABC transporter ATP-binding protein [Mesorhizobium sp. M7A.F.Ca.MR.176.00.0.0]RVD19227.1 ABC transporter ATP-binding protein [Mesorhizobium sp. M7A.F.Ca.ET.027.02.1.1]RVD53971.1 ABC transporter ATP-binding protein [Mesorhizobium
MSEATKRQGETRAPVLTARNVVRRFGGLVAVNDVSFDVKAGEILGLIGPNGAGKTTMFDLLAGSILPTSGEILLNGTPVSGEAAHLRIGHGLGRTFQIPRPLPNLTLIENIMLAAQGQAGEKLLANFITPWRVAAQERAARTKALELLELVTLTHLAHEPARVLSGGQRKLLELARVMMADPAIILLDEPAAGVNATLLEVIIDRIRDINARGITFLLIEHNIDMVTRLCHRVLVMASGQLLSEGTAEEVARDPRVIEAYLGGAA